MILVPDLADIIKHTVSPAERWVAELLDAVEGPDDAVAFHSVTLRSHPYKQQAEADFVILWKGVVLVIEVKGGGVRKHDGIWYSINRRGDWKKLATSPMEQASSAMFALRAILRAEGLGWYAQEAMVITPDIDAPPRAVGWEPTHWLAQHEMSPAALAVAFDAVVADRQTAPPATKIARLQDLRDRLFGAFTRMPVIDAQRGAVLEEQNRATEAQARVLSSLARNRRMLVLGGAGTGKSLVMAEAAKQEAMAGRSVLVTFRSPALINFFTPLVADRKIDIVPFDELNEGTNYDVVLIDEAQDLMNAEAMDRLDAVIAGGRADGRWRMFLDPNNQAHVDGYFDEDVFELIEAEAPTFDLDRNVRNTKAIVHVVQEYLGADVGDPGIVHGEKIQWNWSKGSADIDEASSVAHKMISDGAQRTGIWIISVTSDAAPTSTSDGITVTSPRFAKGLEAEHVVVCDLPKVFDANGVAAFYVAVTRARVSLHIVASTDDKRRLQELVRERGALK
ncbi:NERD domain-containing protein [Nocardia yamanashiensis]|uniref:nuclease-related domain-containing DEAD/DEAH box helicase n=1 Tax=Nocardia yamanashiensis TaxID=209247 RepID=UPI001E324813|nr:NERD domain-containing protein [Nocardia yamanashiensis]UGT42005.1 NERD domain-containing protein [Nocardia yamanashiensis]